MDLDRIIGELELEQQVVARRATDLTEALATLRKLQQGVSSNGAVSTNGDAPRKGRKTVDWVRARQMYENGGVPVQRISTALGVSLPAIYAHAKAEQWKRADQ